MELVTDFKCFLVLIWQLWSALQVAMACAAFLARTERLERPFAEALRVMDNNSAVACQWKLSLLHSFTKLQGTCELLVTMLASGVNVFCHVLPEVRSPWLFLIWGTP